MAVLFYTCCIALPPKSREKKPRGAHLEAQGRRDG